MDEQTSKLFWKPEIAVIQPISSPTNSPFNVPPHMFDLFLIDITIQEPNELKMKLHSELWCFIMCQESRVLCHVV